MNITNILLGTTSLLIVVAFAVSFGGLKDSKESAETQLLRDQIRAEIAKAEAEAEALRLEQLRASAPYTVSSVIPPMPATSGTTANAPSDAELVNKLTTAMEDKERLAGEKYALEEKLRLAEEETETAYAEKNKIKEEERRRAAKVRNALLMGTVTNANKENALVIFEPTEHANFQPGKVLNVRRNDGIIGQVEVDRLENNLYVCNMRPHGYSPDGYPDIQPGDEVIIDHGGQ